MSARKPARVLNIKKTPISIDSKGTLLGGRREMDVDLNDPSTASALEAGFLLVLSVPEEKAPAKKAPKSAPEPRKAEPVKSAVQSEAPQVAPAQIVSEEG